MTAATEVPPRPVSPIERWLRLGSRPRPWIHGLAAFGVGILAALAGQWGALALVLAGPPAFALDLLITGVSIAAFGFIGALFLVDRRGWLLGFTAFLTLPLAVGTYWASIATSDGGLSGLAIGPALIAAAASAVPALLAHAGPTRLIAVLLAGATIAMSWAIFDTARHESAVDRLGTSLRPYVTEVPGYESWLDPKPVADGSDALWQDYYAVCTDACVPGFVLVTETATSQTPCGQVLRTFNNGLPATEELTCDKVGDRWVRTGVNTHELAVIMDGFFVRANASSQIPLSDLEAAIGNLSLMDDAHYAHMLYGRDGDCLPDMDPECP